MKRKIEFIVVHCTCTPSDYKVSQVKDHWHNNLGLHLPDCHYLICKDGYVSKVIADRVNVSGVKDFNEHSIHLSYIGGLDRNGKAADTRTERQKDAMFDLIVELSEKYPGAVILGHRDMTGGQTHCPGFDVKSWLAAYEPKFD